MQFVKNEGQHGKSADKNGDAKDPLLAARSVPENTDECTQHPTRSETRTFPTLSLLFSLFSSENKKQLFTFKKNSDT